MKKQLLILVVSFLLVVNYSFAQAPGVAWTKCLGGSENEEALTTQHTNDGGYIMAGYSMSNDGNVTNHHGTQADYWVVKVTSSGAIQWQKSMGGSMGDTAYSIQQTIDGGYIVVGVSYSNNGNVTGHHGTVDSSDFWVVKLSTTGSIEWQNSLGGTRNDKAYSIQQTVDGGYIVAGLSFSMNGDVTEHFGLTDSSDYWVVKLSNNGAIEWEKSYGGLNSDAAKIIQQTSDSGYIVAGYSESKDSILAEHYGLPGKKDFWVLKLSDSGKVQWHKSYGGGYDDEPNYMFQTSDSGYILAGCTKSNGGDVKGHLYDNDYWVLKLSDTGKVQWQKCLGGLHSDVANCIQNTSDGGYVIAGGSSSFNNSSAQTNSIYIVKFSDTGAFQWEKKLGSGFGDDIAYNISQTTDSGYIVTGTASTFNGSLGKKDFLMMRLDWTVAVNEISKTDVTLLPNPTYGQLFVTGISTPIIVAYNMMGQKVATANSQEINLVQLPVGVYMVQVYSKDLELLKSEMIVKE